MDSKIVVSKNDKGYYSIKLFGARTSFAFLDKAAADGKFRSEFLIPDNAPGVSELKEAIMAVGLAKFGQAKFKPSALKIGNSKIADMVGQGHDEADLKHYKDMIIISANTGAEKPPKLLGGPFYSGCYVLAEINLAAVEYQSQKYVKGYLQAVKFLANGENLGGTNGPDTSWMTEVPAEKSEATAEQVALAKEIFGDDVPF